MRTYLFILGVVSSYFLHGQNYFSLAHPSKSMVNMGLHADPHMNAQVDFNYSNPEKNSLLQRVGLCFQLHIPIFSQKGFDFDAGIGPIVRLKINSNYSVFGGLQWNISKSEDINAKYIHSGLKLDIIPAFQKNNHLIGFHTGVHYQPWIHIKHKDYAMRRYIDLYPNGNGTYMGPKDGWFTQPYVCIQTGIAYSYLKPDGKFQ